MSASRSQALLCSKAQELLHVAVFRPADVGKRVVLALVFIAGIVTSRAVGSRHEDLNLFQVTLVPGEAEFDRSHVNDAAAVAANFHRQPAGGGRLGRSRDDGAVDAGAAGERTKLLRKLRTAHERRVRAESAGEHDAVSLRSVAITTPPCRRANWAINCPTSPKPMTATLSPSEMFAMRTALSAMLPRVVKQACSKGTPSGTLATRLRPTRMASACPVPSPP